MKMLIALLLLLIGTTFSTFASDLGESLKGECIYSPSNSRKADLPVWTEDSEEEESKASEM
tara:strand:+ start:3722 stop:3904 length:183 start_codon:yes stop_codon:yes gene_type:complete